MSSRGQDPGTVVADSQLAVAAARRPRILSVKRFPGSTIVGSAILLVLILAATFGPSVVSYEPNAVDPVNAFQAPSAEHPMGTDNLGRDVLSRFVTGARVSLAVGFGATLIGAIVGTILGVIAGLFGRYVDGAISWVIEVLQAFPGVLLALVIIAILGPGLQNVLIAVGVAFVPSYARLSRALVFSLRERTFIEAARAIGNPSVRVVTRHLLPNTMRSLIVLASLGLGAAILEGAALSFLGLGIQPPDAEWGAMLSSGAQFIQIAWWLTVFPGIGIVLAVLAANLVGEGLTGDEDPR